MLPGDCSRVVLKQMWLVLTKYDVSQQGSAVAANFVAASVTAKQEVDEREREKTFD